MFESVHDYKHGYEAPTVDPRPITLRDAVGFLRSSEAELRDARRPEDIDHPGKVRNILKSRCQKNYLHTVIFLSGVPLKITLASHTLQNLVTITDYFTYLHYISLTGWYPVSHYTAKQSFG